MGNHKSCILLLLVAFAASSCAPTTRFEWGNYENALYQYYKAPSQLISYREDLREAIDSGVAEDRLSPGLYAELGYTYLEQGNLETARELFQSEMQNFPESRPFLGRLIERLSQSAADGTPIS